MKAACYLRMSTDKQENSIGSQSAALLAYAERNNIQIVQKYIDEGISGRSAEKRPSFMKMIEDSPKKLFDSVLVYDSSRFARNLEEAIVYKSVLKRNGVMLISITEPNLDDDNSLITDAMLGALNEMYSRKLSKAVKRGMIYNAQRGIYQTPPPYGYKKQNGIMEIVEEEAKIVNRIFNMFVESPSWHSVAVKLNDTGVHKRKNVDWYSRDIKRMLNNVAYIGNVYYDGQIYKGKHEPIIDDSLWDNVHKLISEKTKCGRRPPSTYKHWLSGLLECGNCGGRMNYISDKRGNASFRCSRNANGCCKHSNYISVSVLERLAVKVLEDVVSGKKATYEYNRNSNIESDMLEGVRLSLRNVRSKLKRHKEAYSAGVDTLDEYRSNKESCLKEEAALLKKMEELSLTAKYNEAANGSTADISQLPSFLFLDNYSTEQKNIAISGIIQKIVINKDKSEFMVYLFL